jgi:hypothetical protein
VIKDLLRKIKESDSDNLNLYFVTRKLKKGIKARAKVLEKYEFTVYSVDIDDEIREHLYDLTIKQFDNVVEKELETTPFEVISDDIKKIFTYDMTNRAMSFADVVNNQLANKSLLNKINDLSDLLKEEELWAYSVGFYDESDDDWFYTFRKILRGKVVVDEENRKSKKQKVNFFRAKFDVDNSKLEMLHGETVNLDEKVDCIFYNEVFYILQRTQFEQITGMAEEFKVEAQNVVEELKKTNLFEGLELLEQHVEDKPPLHKKLVRLKKVNTYQNLKIKDINRMLKIAKKYGGILRKDKSGKLLIESKEDIDLTIKVLVDYFKKGEFSGNSYGTYSGKQIS